MELKSERTKRWQGVLLFFVSLIAIIFGPLAYILTSYFPHVLFTYQEAVDGVKDCTSYALKDNTWERLTGEWSFYYDRWIVSDQDSSPRDGVIDPMSSWAGYTLENGTALPREGYASYELKVIGAPAGMPLVLDYLAMDGAYNLYINGELMAASGLPSKSLKENKKASFFTYQKDGVVPSSGEFTIVCELGANDHGGAFSPPCLVPNFVPGTVEDFLTKLLPFISGTLIFALAASALTLFHSQGKVRRDWSLVLILCALAFYFFFSLDMLNAFRYFRVPTSWRLFQGGTIVGEIALTSLLYLYYRHRGYLSFGSAKKDRWAFGVVGSLALGLGLGAFFTYGFSFERFFFYGLVALLLPLLYFAIRSVIAKKKESFLNLAILSLLMDIFLSEGLPYSAYRTTVTSLISSFFCLFLAVLFFLLFWQESAAIRADQEEKERLKEAFLSAKQEALRSQIKPHFVLNCLTAIEDSYHQDQASGDKAITMFAKHLRTDVDTLEVNLVPFSQELDAILNYANLENLRLEKKFLILFDVDYQSFLIPPLSLQPRVENAIKHSGVNEKANGFIQIRSLLQEDGQIEVDVEDNGVGFDPSQVAPTSQGLANARERLHLLLDATLTIQSAPGKGTLCQIVFLPKKTGDNQESKQ
jgi:signal transduction histidine kinase